MKRVREKQWRVGIKAIKAIKQKIVTNFSETKRTLTGTFAILNKSTTAAMISGPSPSPGLYS